MAKILIVDDSVLIRKMLTSFLTIHNHDITTADSGAKCFDLVKDNKYDCILLDLLMPEIDGFMVLEKLKAMGITTPVIIISADIQETSRLKAQNLGACDFLNKPPRPQDLFNAINKVLISNNHEVGK